MSDEEKIDRMSIQIGQLHHAVFGAEGQGGALRELDAVSRRMTAIENFKLKMIGVVIGVSAIMSHVAPKLTETIFKALSSSGPK